MRLLDRLERRFGRWAIPNITLGLIIGQAFLYVLEWTAPKPPDVAMIASRVLAGEYWRLVTFIFTPPASNPIFILFVWSLFYLMGTALEQTWGSFRYNLFLFTGWAATVASSFLVPELPASVLFIESSVFLAFARLYPNFEICILFVLPVKAKWLALITWIMYGFVFLAGPPIMWVLLLASLANYFLFFGTDIYWKARWGRRHMTQQAERLKTRSQPPAARHCCRICGITERTHPNEDFRYCSQCAGTQCYCSAHLHDHAHLMDAEMVEGREAK